MLSHPIASPFSIEGGDIDDDKDFDGAKCAAIGLIEEILKKRGSVVAPVAYREILAQILIDRSDDDDAWNEYASFRREDSERDPFTMSLNWRWPSIIRALIVVATRSENAHCRDQALNAIERELLRSDVHGASRAALGGGFGSLLSVAPMWINTHVDDLVGTRDGISVEQQITLTTALAIHYYNDSMYDLLTPAMLAAIDVGDSLAAGWKTKTDPLTKIGEWVIDAFIYGHIDETDPVLESFFIKTSPTVRGAALTNIARKFHRSTTVDEAIRDRFATLWDERTSRAHKHPENIKELEGIYWLAKSSSFSSKWWLPRLRQILELEPSITTERYRIGKELAQASTTDPSAALAVLKLLLSTHNEDVHSMFDLNRFAVPMVIANAMSSSDRALAAQAEAYMNELGAHGNLDLEDRVLAVLKDAANMDETDE